MKKQKKNIQKEIPQSSEPGITKLLETIDFSVIRNYFLYSLSPRGIKATISRRVTIELQKEKDGGLLDLLKNPMVWMMFILALIIIATVVYPAITSQAPITECQNKLTTCIAAAQAVSAAGGVSIS